MGRGRLNMELIPNEKTRRTTFQKRRKGMMKKAYELSTLCDTDVCMIICGPQQSDRPMELHTWPENPDEVNRIIDKYKVSTMHRPPKKTVQLSDLLEDRMNKAVADIARARREMYEAKYPTWDEGIDSLTGDQLESLLHGLDAKIESEKKMYFDLRKGSDADADDEEGLVVQNSTSKLLLGGGNHNYGEASEFRPCNDYNFVPDSTSKLLLGVNHDHHAEASELKPCNNYTYVQDEDEDVKSYSSLINMGSFPFSSFDHHQQSDQTVQFDSNLTPMMSASNSNYNYNYSLQFMSAGASSSNSQYNNATPPPPLMGYPTFNDHLMIRASTTTTTLENMMMFNIPGSSMSHYAATRLMQPLPSPYMQYPVLPSISPQALAPPDHQTEDHPFDNVNEHLIHNRMP